MLDRETIIWEIRQALKILNNASEIEILNHRCYVLEPMDIIGITLALNHAIGVRDETH